jgi:8-hydroxy-5-deazaflavin:NADPH oxidoreductase
VKIAVIGRGNVGGGLAKLWRAAGHDVDGFGRDGGDVSGAEVVLLAVPSDAIADALGSVAGIEDRPLIDATNLIRGDRPEGFNSLAEYAKSLTGGPAAKAFNTNFAALYERLGEARSRPVRAAGSVLNPGGRRESLILRLRGWAGMPINVARGCVPADRAPPAAPW